MLENYIKNKLFNWGYIVGEDFIRAQFRVFFLCLHFSEFEIICYGYQKEENRSSYVLMYIICFIYSPDGLHHVARKG